MGLISKYLNWDLKNFDNVIITKDSSIIIFHNQQKSSVHHLDKNNWTISEPFHDNSSDLTFFVEISDNVYQICENGGILRLSCSSNTNGSFLFGSGSSGSDSFSWNKVSKICEGIYGVAGKLSDFDCRSLNNLIIATSNGFAAVVKNESCFYLKIFEIGESVGLRSTKRIPVSPYETKFVISRLDICKLGSEFVKHVFKEISLVLTDLILVCSGGFVLLFPLIDLKIGEPVEIIWDSDSLVHAAVSENSLIFFYKSGKIVFVVLNNKKLKYTTQYLTTCIVGAAVISRKEQFFILWSDVKKIGYFGPVDFNNLAIKEYYLDVKGVISLTQINDNVLATNLCCNFYRIAIDELKENDTILPNMKEVIKIGSEIQGLKIELEAVTQNYEAILSELTDSSSIICKIINKELRIENLSTKTFSPKIWSFEIESYLADKVFAKRFNILGEFAPNSVNTFPLEYFVSLGCKNINIRLVGVVENFKVLCLNLTTLFLS